MAHSQFDLLKQRRFLPYFTVQALGAFRFVLAVQICQAFCQVRPSLANFQSSGPCFLGTFLIESPLLLGQPQCVT